MANSNREFVNSNNQAIAGNKLLIETFADATEISIKKLEDSLAQYIQQYVQAYVNEAIDSK